MKPVMAAAAASTEAREKELVAAAQAGSVQAFESLFRRYRDRIGAFVRASIRDESRTEDLVQEIFLAAHHSLATLSHPAAFRTWLFQIARNACLDEVRRRARQDELIYGWDEFPPPDERIVVHNQDAERTFSQKEELADLTEALDGLPEIQHEALVMRELEGRSYDEIGRKMRLSKTAVESVLFRARRGLKGEYVAIQTGARCKRMQAVMAEVAEGMGVLQERRKLIRHMRDCASCRREAAALGITGLAVPSDDRRGIERAFSRLAAFLPLPVFLSRRGEGTDQLAGGSSLAAQAQSAAAQLSTIGTDHAVSAVHKAAAVVAAVAVVGGGGVAIEKAGVDLPILGSIVKKHDSKPAAATSGAGGSQGGRKMPTAKGGGGTGAAGVPAALGAAHPGSSAPAGAAAPATEAAPVSENPAMLVSPDPSDAPSADSQDDSSSTTPSNGGETETNTTGGSGTAPATGGDSGAKKDEKSDRDSTTTTGGSDAGSTIPAPTDPALDPLPPGTVRQIESGRRTLEELPRGLKKRLPPDVIAPAA